MKNEFRKFANRTAFVVSSLMLCVQTVRPQELQTFSQATKPSSLNKRSFDAIHAFLNDLRDKSPQSDRSNAMAASSTTTTVYSVVHLFSGTDGSDPEGGLIQASDGFFYGTTEYGGSLGLGTVFKIDGSGNTAVLHSFSGPEGSGPVSSLVQGRDGSFYGTALDGGPAQYGTIFKINQAGTLTILHSFSGSDGIGPYAPLIQANDGNFYGTTAFGGRLTCFISSTTSAPGCGTIFKIDATGNFTSLYSFSGPDGLLPLAALLQTTDGSFYGTAASGGTVIGGGTAFGTIFRMNSSGNVTVLHSFSGTGSESGVGILTAPLIQASDTKLYGTAGAINGAIFRTDSSGNITLLQIFSGPGGGSTMPGLFQASDGNFYGMTQVGGNLACTGSNGLGCGTVFKMDSSGAITALRWFGGQPSDGSDPYAALIQGTNGSLYGTAQYGGPANNGAIFQISGIAPPTTSTTPSISSIANAAGEGSAVAQNTWVEIKGVNLAKTARSWQASDFVNNQLPTQLDGVGVTVNGKSAYVYYISPTQVNALTPVDSSLGSVQVQLTNNGLASAPFTIQLQAYAPGLFEFNGGPYAAATHSNGSLAGPASLFPGSTTPVAPGEILTLYADGFGQTSPPLTAGLVTQTGMLPTLPQIKIGGIASTVQFAGVVSPGLYQLNVFVPSSLPSGNNTVIATYNGVSSNTADISVGAPSSTGTLQIQISGLPNGTSGNVSITSNAGFSTLVMGNETLQVPAGAYTIVANAVPFGNVSYGASPPQQSFTVTGGSVNPITVSYSIIIPNTTMVLDQQGGQGLTVSADGTTLTFPISSQTAQSLSPGTVLAIGSSPAAPNGLLRKVVSVSQNGSQIVAQTTQATFVDAFQQANFTFTTALSPQNTTFALGSLPPGVSMRWKSKEENALTPQDTSPSACSGTSSLLVQMFDAPILSDQNGVITVSGEIDVCPNLTFDPNISAFPPRLNSLIATTTLGENIHVNVTGNYRGSFSQTATFGIAASDPITVFVGPIPIVLTPSVTFFVGISGSAEAGFSVGVTQSASVIGGFSYMNGQLSPVTSNPVATFTTDPFGLDANLSAKAYAGVTVALTVDGVLSPAFSPDAYLQMDVNVLSNPWWTLSAGLEGDASVKVGIFGVGLADFDLPNLFDFSKTIAQASGGFVSSSAAPVLNLLTPNSAPTGSSGLTLTLSGSNFVPGSTARFNGNPLVTTYASPVQLTAALPANLLSAAGTFSVTVTNPDQSGAVSQAISFNVQPSATPNPVPTITSLSPSSAIAGSNSLTVAINGSGYLASSTVTFNGVLHAATVNSANQLTISLKSSDLASPGGFPVIVTNPSPGGGASNALTFTVQPMTTAPTLLTLILSAASVVGGNSVTANMTLSGPAPAGGVNIALSSSNSTAQAPGSVMIASGLSTAVFTITTTAVSSSQTATITASFGSSTATALLTISPSGPVSVTITGYPTPTANSSPYGIAAGPDGALWFTEYGANKIGRITTSGSITEYSVPTVSANPTGIAPGSDGALWFTEYTGNKIGRITTSGMVTEYLLPTASSNPSGITAGPDGSLWFTEYSSSKIGRVTVSGTITEFTLPTPNSSPHGIVAGPDGALWFTEPNGGNVGRITTTGVITEYPAPFAIYSPYGIAVGSDGAIWFTDSTFTSGQIGRMTTAGVTTATYGAGGDTSSSLGEIAAGPDGALWFTQTELFANQIGRITTAGAVTQINLSAPTVGGLPADLYPRGIVAGPDGAIWFTEFQFSQIGRAALH